MQLHTTLEAARIASTADSKAIIEIDHATEGRRYINAKCHLSTLRDALRRKPIAEIKALVAEHPTQAALDLRVEDAAVSAIPGMPAIRQASDAAEKARAAYDRASQHGYPAREAAAMDRTDKALAACRQAHPAAAAYLRAEGWAKYSDWRNTAKAQAGRKACAAILAGADPSAALAAMDAEYASYIATRVD